MKNKKSVFNTQKIGITSSIILSMMISAFFFVPSVNAISTTGTTKQVAAQQQRIDSLKTRASNEIDRRITSMNDLITKINSDKRLTSDQKNAFGIALQSNITDLSTLKTKINADTDLTTLQSDVKSIIDSYRIFAILEPQLRILKAIDSMNTVDMNLATLASTLNTEIQNATSNGKNTSALQTAYNDMLLKIAAATTQYNLTSNMVINLKPANYPAKTTFVSARTGLKTSIQDLKAAATDAKTIMQGLKSLNNSSTTTTVTQ